MGKRDSRASKSLSSKSTKHSLAKISRVGIVAKFPTMSKLGRRNHMDETTIPPFPNTRFRSPQNGLVITGGDTAIEQILSRAGKKGRILFSFSRCTGCWINQMSEDRICLCDGVEDAALIDAIQSV